VKIAPIVEAMERHPEDFQQLLVHTGQHYDRELSQVFFKDLELPRPDIELNVGSGSHAEQTGSVMISFEATCLDKNPALVLVVGDVNSTLACTLAARKLGIPVAHVEAGLRSRDLSMPEEINRLCTDAIADYLFTTEPAANENLRREGVAEDRVHFVGNVMIDTLLKYRGAAEQLPLRDQLGLAPRAYGAVTLHRPSNVDSRDRLKGILEALHTIAEELPLIFPLHPRTKKRLSDFGLDHYFATDKPVRGLWATPPLSYLEFLHLMLDARLVFTDSGGVQEETTALGIPCLTLRNNTERPITCTEGTNELVGNDKQTIVSAAARVLRKERVGGQIPDKWDGRTAERIIAILARDKQRLSVQ
jgi:UDP-N-acetylglucosamine 2-epimerase (non-hydrolysing)